MPQLVMIVDIPDAQPTHEDPHEAAADILYHYEAHREVNQDERDVRFVVAMWAETTPPTRLEFSEVVPDDVRPETYATQLGIGGMSQGKLDDMMAELEREDEARDRAEDADEAWGRSD